MDMLVDRRDELGRARTQTANRLHRLLLELVPGGAKKFLSAAQARDLVGKTRCRLAVELISKLEEIDKKIKTADTDLTRLITARRSTLMDLYCIGSSCAARLLADADQSASSVTGLTPHTGPSDKSHPRPVTILNRPGVGGVAHPV